MTAIGRTPALNTFNSNTSNSKLSPNFNDTVLSETSGTQKVALAPVAIGWYAANAIWINPLVYTACIGLGAWAVRNIFRILKDEPQESLTATQAEQLSKAKQVIARDPRFIKTAPIEIQEKLGVLSNTVSNVHNEELFKLLYSQALNKRLRSNTLTEKQRADLISLESSFFKAEESQNNEQGQSPTTQENTKKPVRLKRPKKPKKPSQVSKPTTDKLTGKHNDGGYISQSYMHFKNPQSLPQLKEMLAIAKSPLTTQFSAKYIAYLERFIALAERNFCSGRLPVKDQVMDMAAIAKKLGWH